jgi:TolB protein
MDSMTVMLRTCALAASLVMLVATSVRADVAGTTQQLGGSPGTTQIAPAISGTGVVWTHYDGTQFDIFYVDVATGAAPVNITNSPDDEFLEDIDRGAIVYTHSGGMLNSPGDILLYDTATGTVGNVAVGGDAVHFSHPAISGNYIVFERITSQYDIDIYDRTIGGSPGGQVTDDAAMQLHPRVSGDVVVYEDYARNPGGPPDVYGYHVMTQTRFLIAENASWPDVDGDNVVYVAADTSGNDQIYLYGLTSGIRRALTSAHSAKSTPRISGTRIIWTDGRNGTDDVFAYDLSTGVEDLLAGGPGGQTVGDISGDRAVYNSSTANGGTGGVFLFTFKSGTSSGLPLGCDPALTDIVDGPTTMTMNTTRPVYARGTFDSITGRNYYLCIENGLPDGSRRAKNVITAVDGAIVITPSDFQPHANPPRYVATPLSFERRGWAASHEWDAALFEIGTTIAVSVRVAK